jgi:hypothetical protein
MSTRQPQVTGGDDNDNDDDDDDDDNDDALKVLSNGTGGWV